MVNISLVGPSYPSRSIPLSSQSTVNLYPELPANGLSASALMCWPGAKLFSEGSAVNRGISGWRGNLYTVNGQALYKIDSAGVKTNLGAITGTARCVFAGGNSWLYIVSEGLVYRTNGTLLETVTDVDLETPNSVAYLNNQFIYDGNQGRFAVSDVGDGSSVDGLNYATAESYNDDLKRVYVFNQQLYLMGEFSIEPWYNSGVGNPPFDRIDGGLSQIGIAGVHAVTNTNNGMYFLGHDRACYRLNGYIPEQISTQGINNAIEQFDDVSDCFCFSLKLQGQSFIAFSFPSGDKTFCYSEPLNFWFELSTGLDGGRHLANGYTFLWGKHIVSDYRSGNIYEWDLKTFTDNGEPIVRERTTQPIYSDFAAQPDKAVFWNSIKLTVNSGYGLTEGQGVDPQVMMQFSDDNGHTFSNEQWRSLGKSGEYQKEVEWSALGSSLNRIYRFRVTDPIEAHFFKLSANLELGI